jgi:hypothetical protein
MATRITDLCIGCGACVPECPNGAIREDDPIYMTDPGLCAEGDHRGGVPEPLPERVRVCLGLSSRAFLQEHLISSSEPVRVGPEGRTVGQANPGVVKFLESVEQHGAVLLLQNLPSHFDAVIRPYGKELAVVCRVMELAQREAVGNDGFPAGLAVGDDMSRIEKFIVSQVAQSALFPVCLEYSFPEDSLM